MGANQHTKPSDHDYFYAHATVGEGCWVWQGCLSKTGYGMTTPQRYRMAHRMSYAVHKGELDPRMQIDHLCSRPSCVNPDHLDQVPQQVDGVRRRIRNHWRGWATHCARGHEMNDVTTLWRTNGEGRQCRVCQYDRTVEYRARNNMKPLPPFNFGKVSSSIKHKWMYRPSAADYELAAIDLRFVKHFWAFDPMRSSSLAITEGAQAKGAFQL